MFDGDQTDIFAHMGLVYSCANKYRSLLQSSFDYDDLVQAGVIGLIRAQKTYDKEKGSWAKWAMFYIRTEMLTVCGFRGTKRRPEWGAASLDAPIGEDDTTLLDMLASEYVDLHQGIEFEELRRIVRDCVEELQDELQRKAIEYVDLDGMTYEKAAEAAGTTAFKIKAAQQHAYFQLRNHPMIREVAIAYGWFHPREQHLSIVRQRKW